MLIHSKLECHILKLYDLELRTNLNFIFESGILFSEHFYHDLTCVKKKILIIHKYFDYQFQIWMQAFEAICFLFNMTRRADMSRRVIPAREASRIGFWDHLRAGCIGNFGGRKNEVPDLAQIEWLVEQICLEE